MILIGILNLKFGNVICNYEIYNFGQSGDKDLKSYFIKKKFQIFDAHSHASVDKTNNACFI